MPDNVVMFPRSPVSAGGPAEPPPEPPLMYALTGRTLLAYIDCARALRNIHFLPAEAGRAEVEDVVARMTDALRALDMELELTPSPLPVHVRHQYQPTPPDPNRPQD